jgi:hypothetical protein
MSEAESQATNSSRPSSRKNRRSKEFRFHFDDLPADIQVLAKKAFHLFVSNPQHPALRLHRLKDNRKGQHRTNSWSVSVTMEFRALYVEVGDTNVWYWIGTHAAYNHFTGRN